MSARKKVCLLVNPKAGNGLTMQMLSKVENTLRGFAINFRTIITNDITHSKQVAASATARDECIAVMGGDGTASIVAGVLTGLRGSMALIPAGRGNDFARMLNYPNDPVAACKVIDSGKEINVDMGQINGRPFLNICSLGFDSIANHIANTSPMFRGKAVYLYAGLRALIGWKPAIFQVMIDGNKYDHMGYTVAVANSQCYGGGMYLSPDSSIVDGLLDVVFIGEIPKLRLIKNIPRLFKKIPIREPEFRIIRGREVRITSKPLFTVYADGDAIQISPVTIKILPRTLKVLVPA